jgi:hypothetical protein
VRIGVDEHRVDARCPAAAGAGKRMTNTDDPPNEGIISMHA